MFQEYAGIKVLCLFLENPFKEFYLREIARNLNISTQTAKRFIDLFLMKGIISRQEKGNLHILKLNSESIFVKQMKLCLNIFKINETKIVKKLVDELNASAVILFGSIARGEDDKNSDLDLLVISKEKRRPNLENLEKKLGRSINLITYSVSDWRKKVIENKSFYEKIVYDGIVLFGEMPVIL